MAKAIWDDWPQRWVAYSCWEATQDDCFPSAARWVDASWRPAGLAALVGYLRGSPVYCIAPEGRYRCAQCGRLLDNVGVIHWDGEWLWPSGLAHDTAEHSFRLPEALVRRIRERDYIPPAWDESDLPRIDRITAGLSVLLEERRPRGPAAPNPAEPGAAADRGGHVAILGCVAPGCPRGC